MASAPPHASTLEAGLRSDDKGRQGEHLTSICSLWSHLSCACFAVSAAEFCPVDASSAFTKRTKGPSCPQSTPRDRTAPMPATVAASRCPPTSTKMWSYRGSRRAVPDRPISLTHLSSGFTRVRRSVRAQRDWIVGMGSASPLTWASRLRQGYGGQAGLALQPRPLGDPS
jgi:hypothetical protein